MNAFKTLAAAATLVASTLQLAAKPLPTCDDPQVRETFIQAAQPFQIYEITDYKNAASTGDKRWCYAYFVGGRAYMQAIFTLEWVNEPENRYWLQTRALDRTCRGVMGDPWSTERCGKK